MNHLVQAIKILREVGGGMGRGEEEALLILLKSLAIVMIRSMSVSKSATG